MRSSLTAIRQDRHARQFVKFVLVGGMTTAINFSIYAILVFLGVHYLPAAVIAFSVATLNSYTFNRAWTFRAGPHQTEHLVKFSIVQLVGLSINLLVLYLLVEHTGLGKFVAQFIANGFVVASNFTGNKFWTFRE